MNTQHIEIVAKALELEKRLKHSREEHQQAVTSRQAKEKEAPPAPPTPKTIPAPKEPVITPTVTFNWKIAFLPAIICWASVVWVSSMIPFFFIITMLTVPWIGVYTYFFYWKPRNEEIARIRASAEHLEQYRLLLEEHQHQQAAENEKHEKAMDDYKIHVLAPFELERCRVIGELEITIQRTADSIDRLEQELSQLYTESGIIPPQYRYEEALWYIHDLMENGYELEEAFAEFDAFCAQVEEEERLREEELEAQADELFDNLRHGVHKAAGVAAGVAVAHHVVKSHQKKAEKAAKEAARNVREPRYICSFSCPHRRTNTHHYHGVSECKLNQKPGHCSGKWMTY